MLLSLVPNEMILAEKRLVTIFVLTYEILGVIVTYSPAPWRRHRCSLLHIIRLIPLQN